MSDCNCKKDKCLSPAVLQINNHDCPTVFHKVTFPAAMGDDKTNPPRNGQYRNVLLVYEANKHVYMFSSDGIPTLISDGSRGIDDYNELTNKPSIEGHELVGDSSLEDIGVTDAIEDALEDYSPTSDLAEVAFSGDYNDLSNKPTIGNATLTIQKNGTAVDTFTANATSNKTINITVPTTAADVSALPASTKYGASISVSLNTTDYKMTTTLKDQDGNTLGTAQTVDLPLESVVVNGSYDNTNKKIILTLQNGNTVDIPVGDLVAGLQTEITSTNKLSSDLVDDTNHTNKFVTAAQIAKLNGIAAGAEVNVQSDWSVTDTTSDAFIKNKPTIPAAQVNSDWNASSGVAQILNKPNLAAVATSGDYNDLENTPPKTFARFYMLNPSVGNAAPIYHDYRRTDQVTLAQFTDAIASGPVQIYMEYDGHTFRIHYVDQMDAFIPDPPMATGTLYVSFGLRDQYGLGVRRFLWYEPDTAPIFDGYDSNQSDWNETSSTNSSYIKNKPNLAAVATSGSYNDLSNKPTIPAAQVNSDWSANSGVAQILNKPTLATVATSGSYNDLSDKPTIPTVNDATLTITQNGASAGTFTANASSDTTISLTDTTYSDFSGATSSAAGAHGLVPAPSAGDQEKVLHGDGTWQDATAKLIEMSYGESNAWAKFIAAYQAGSIVYCRASSNANPASGSQTRKAFMAYVNNAESPTSVEFQYVRSVSSKTASQPVDQVLVYTLTNANGGTWAVKTRDMGPKLAAGTNTTVSYSNGTYTISATGGGGGGGGPTVVQTTGQSTTDVMSQKAVTDIIGNVETILRTLNSGTGAQ